MSGETDLDASYIDIPYPSAPVRCTHPDIQAVVGTLAGLKPAPPARCRMLEIGCGDGGNLLSMALTLPGAEFVGIEPSPPAVERARSRTAELGLTNILFEQMGVEDLDARHGSFDYILAHGVFSWVAPALQDKILEVSRRLLRPDGLVYISYNTYPGWHARGMIREMMLYHVRDEPSPKARVTRARKFLARLTDTVGATEKGGLSATDLEAYGALLRHERDMLSRHADAYFYHEHLERMNLPLYFHEFTARAGRHGLQYVSEALYSSSLPVAYPEVVGDFARELAQDPMQVQQMLDFAINRAFRQSILCASDRTVVRTADPNLLRSFYVSSPLKPVSTSGDAQILAVPWGWAYKTTDPEVHAALVALGEKWPAPVPVESLLIAPEALLDVYTRGMLEFQAGPPHFTTSIAGRPTASALARLQAKDGNIVSNLRHEQAALDDLSRSLIPFLDGTRDPAALLACMNGLADEGRMAVTTSEGKPVTDPDERTRLMSGALAPFLKSMADAALLSA